MGHWAHPESIEEFHLESDTRRQGWCLEIEFEQPDAEGVQMIRMMLDGGDRFHSYADIYRWFHPDTWMKYHTPSGFRYGSILGTVESPQSEITLVKRVVKVGGYLVLGDGRGTPERVWKSPIKSIIKSFTDYGG